MTYKPGDIVRLGTELVLLFRRADGSLGNVVLTSSMTGAGKLGALSGSNLEMNISAKLFSLTDMISELK